MSFANSMQQNTGANNIVATSQNGFKPGDTVSYQINDDGTVVGNYSNEQTQVLGQIVLANFANNEGLKSEGDNVWSATQSSGVALLGTAGSGNFGTLTNGALEASNVDLSKELVNMIVAQRNYQSNAQTIKTRIRSSTRWLTCVKRLTGKRNGSRNIYRDGRGKSDAQSAGRYRQQPGKRLNAGLSRAA